MNKFSGHLAELSVPIYAVTGSEFEWYWGSEQQKAFEKIKAELSNAPVLCAFDFSRRHRVSADASKNAIGAVLLQSNEDNLWQLVEYTLRKMTEAKCRYAMIKRH